MNEFPKELVNTITLGDTIETLKSLPDDSVDLIFADPPYNMQTSGVLKRVDGSTFSGVDSDWDKFDSLESYSQFTREWLLEAQRVLKKDKSSLWVCGSYQNIYIVGSILQELGFWIINDVVWSKKNPTPNLKGSKFTNKQETLLWATPTKKTKYTFNYKTMKKYNNDKQMTSVWEIPIASGNERLKDENGKKVHPTQKPEELLYRVILSSTKKGDLVVDPFMGTGTTGAMCKRLGRNFFGIERDKTYRSYALDRIDKEVVLNDDFINARFDIKPPKVKFKELVDKNYISADEPIYFRGDEDIVAYVSSEKELFYNNEHWGISKLAGVLDNKTENSNGWDAWYVKRNNSFVVIDELRKKYRYEILNFEE